MKFNLNATNSVAASAIKTRATALFLCFFTAFLTACTPGKPQFKSIDLTGADYAKDFAPTTGVVDQNGKVRTVRDFAGSIVVVFFGFTQCPDVCPASMTELAGIKKSLGTDGNKLQAVFVSVDPERDTPEVLKAYMANFDPAFLALRPTLAQLPAIAKDFKIYYKKVEGKTSTSYSMDHSAGYYIYDTQGRLRLYSRYGSDVAGLTDDLRQLLQGR